MIRHNAQLSERGLKTSMSIVYLRNKERNVTYVYEAQSYYVPELKQSRSKRKLIGKLDPVTGEVVPTGKRRNSKEVTDQEETSPDTPEDQEDPKTRTSRKIEKMQSEIDSLRAEVKQKDRENWELKRALEKCRKKLSDIARTANDAQAFTDITDLSD